MTTFSSIVLKIVVKDHVLLKILYILIFCGIEVPCSLDSCWRESIVIHPLNNKQGRASLICFKIELFRSFTTLS